MALPAFSGAGVSSMGDLIDLLAVAVLDVPRGVVVNGRAAAASATLHCARAGLDVLSSATGDSVLPGGEISYNDIAKVACVEDMVTIESSRCTVTLRGDGVEATKGIAYVIDRRRFNGSVRVAQPAAGGGSSGAPTPLRSPSEQFASPNVTPTPAAPGSTTQYVTPTSSLGIQTQRYAGTPSSGARVNYGAAMSVLDSLLAGKPVPIAAATAAQEAKGRAVDFTSSHLVRGGGSPSASTLAHFTPPPPFNSVPGLVNPSSHVRAPGTTPYDRFFDPNGAKAARAFPQMAAAQSHATSLNASGISPGLDGSMGITSSLAPPPPGTALGGVGPAAPAPTRRVRQLEESLEEQKKDIAALRGELDKIRGAALSSPVAAPARPPVQQPQSIAALLSSGTSGALANGKKVSLDFESILMPTIADATDGGTASGHSSHARQRGASLAHRFATGASGVSGGRAAPAAAVSAATPSSIASVSPLPDYRATSTAAALHLLDESTTNAAAAALSSLATPARPGAAAVATETAAKAATAPSARPSTPPRPAAATTPPPKSPVSSAPTTLPSNAPSRARTPPDESLQPAAVTAPPPSQQQLQQLAAPPPKSIPPPPPLSKVAPPPPLSKVAPPPPLGKAPPQPQPQEAVAAPATATGAAPLPKNIPPPPPLNKLPPPPPPAAKAAPPPVAAPAPPPQADATPPVSAPSAQAPPPKSIPPPPPPKNKVGPPPPLASAGGAGGGGGGVAAELAKRLAAKAV